MEEKQRKPSRSELVNLLLQEKGNKCPICGNLLNLDNCTIDHIYPRRLGGTDEIDNLQLLCAECNSFKGEVPFLGYEFELYIKRLLQAHSKYSVVNTQIDFGKDTASPDLVFYKNSPMGKELVFAEVEIARLFTEHRVIRCIQQLHNYLKKEPEAKLVFITPGDLPQKYIRLVRDSGIELWDREFIAKEFSDQIQSAQPVSFKNFFQLEIEEDKFDLLIRKLKTCPVGTSNWGKYQTLVGEILETICCPPLKPPMPQKNDGAKKNRRDYILPNYSREKDTWEFLRDRYNADYIVVDAKNSGKYITKQDVLQIANYLKRDGTGLFGIIIARKGTNSTSEYVIREMWLYEHKLVVVLNDDDIEQMILARKNGADPAELILKKIEDFRLSI